MTSTVPGAIAWPGIAFTLLVVGARWHWFRADSFNKYFNNTLTLLVLAEILREPVVQQALWHHTSVTTSWAQQLSAVLLGFAATEFIGFTMLWSGLSPTETQTRQRRYRWMATGFSAAYLACGTPARTANQPLEIANGWDRVAAWTFSVAMLIVLSVYLLRRVMNAFHTAHRVRERLVVIGALTLGVTIALACIQEVILQICDQFGWTNTASYRLQIHGASVFYVVSAIALLGAVPCAYRLGAWLGLDPASKNWRALQAMRYDMRGAVPGCAFDFESTGLSSAPYLRLHHTVVEIRDAMLQLRLYVHEIPNGDLRRLLDGLAATPAERPAATQALYLAQAAMNKIDGAAPAAVDPDLIDRSTATTLEDEAAELTRLARWWPAASTAILTDPPRVSDETPTERPRI